MVGVTVVIITCTYHGHEFVRVGYYVNNEYSDPELRETPPETPDFSKVCLCSFPVLFSCFKFSRLLALVYTECQDEVSFLGY